VKRFVPDASVKRRHFETRMRSRLLEQKHAAAAEACAAAA
jgi:hypothetical protein